MWPSEEDSHGGQENNLQTRAVPPSWERDSNVVQMREQSWNQSRMLQRGALNSVQGRHFHGNDVMKEGSSCLRLW